MMIEIKIAPNLNDIFPNHLKRLITKEVFWIWISPLNPIIWDCWYFIIMNIKYTIHGYSDVGKIGVNQFK